MDEALELEDVGLEEEVVADGEGGSLSCNLEDLIEEIEIGLISRRFGRLGRIILN